MERHRIPTPKEITSYLKRPLRDASAIVFAVGLALSLPSSPTELQFAARIAQASDCGPIRGEGIRGIVNLEAVTSRTQQTPGDEVPTQLRVIFKDVPPPGSRTYVVDTIEGLKVQIDTSNLIKMPTLKGIVEWTNDQDEKIRRSIDPTGIYSAEVLLEKKDENGGTEDIVVDRITPGISPLQGCFSRTR